MSIWGHEVVFVEKDCEKRCWIVSTADTRQPLVTIPWVDAYRGYTKKQAPDYVEAINTCQSNAQTRLTPKEEATALDELNGRRKTTPREVPKIDVESAKNVLSLEEFKKRKKT